MDPRRLGQAEGVWTESQRSQDSNTSLGNLLAVQWLGLSTSSARAAGSIPGSGTKITHAMWHGQNIKIGSLNKNKKKK